MESNETIIQAKIPPTFLQLYLDKAFSDVAICVDGDIFHCHRFILAAFSDYFRAMFSHGMVESQKHQIELKQVDCRIMSSIVNYFYGGILKITEENVQGIAITASMFNVVEIVKTCCDFLSKNLNCTNCVQILTFAELYNFHELAQTAYDFILDNFEKCTSYDAFYEIAFHLLNKILPSERLSVKNELTVLNTLKKWVETDVEKRKDQLVDLLSHVRLAIIPMEQLIDFEENDTLLKESIACFQMLLEAKNFHYLPEKFFSTRTKMRHSSESNSCAGIGGGGTRAISVKLDSYYNHDAGGAVQASRRSSYATVAIGHKVFAFGGYGSTFTREPLSSTVCFDCTKKYWCKSNLPDLPRPIAALAVCQCDDKLYIIGGEVTIENGNKEVTDEVAYLHCKSNKWVYAASMLTKRCYCEVAVLGDVIYVVGGKDESGMKLKIVERYNSVKDDWQRVSDINDNYQTIRLIAYKNYLYLYGYNERGNSCERYIPHLDLWEKIKFDLTISGSSFDCWISGGSIRSTNDDVRTFQLPPN